MREFKFRAWDEKNSKMYYSDNLPANYYFGHDGNNKIYFSGDVWDNDEQMYYRDTISSDAMQFTGQHDKNGKKFTRAMSWKWGSGEKK